MAKVYDVNTALPGGSAAVFKLKETLKTAGWTVSASSDGSTMFGSTDGLTHSGSGAGGMDNGFAWYWILDPILSRSFVIQRSNGTNPAENWRMKWVRSGGRMTANTGSIAQVPSSSLDHIVMGSGSDAAPSFQRMFASPSGSIRTNVVAFNSQENSGSVYPFYMWCNITGAGTWQSVLTCDAMPNNGFSPSDPEPYSLLIGGTIDSTGISDSPNLGLAASSIMTDTYIKFWNGTNMLSGGLSFRNGGSLASTAATWTTWGSAGNPFNGSEFLIPIIHFRRTALSPTLVVKGQSKYIFASTIGRTFPNTVNLTTDAKVYMGIDTSMGLLFPWPENVSPIA